VVLDLGAAADHVLAVRRQGGGRAGLGDTDEGGALDRHPQEEVSEREVGEELPLGHHHLQVVDLASGQAGVLGEEIGEGAHSTTAMRSCS
jgi:hypothetical protein